MVNITNYPSRADWLIHRSATLGGSDAACVLGVNPYKTNTELWKEKKYGLKEDIDNAAMAYGRNAEESLRQIFKLDYPNLKVEYLENNIWLNDDYPFAHASLDGWLIDNHGRLGILEIKTGTLSNQVISAQWRDDTIPQNYYCQLLHYFAVTNAKFAVLKAYLKLPHKGDNYAITKHYFVERSEHDEAIAELIEKEKEFWGSLNGNKAPAQILPEI